ncbi:v-type ATP synthase subunit D [Striga asiatica]|uniref:V-type ATP synthase subunit D n=1 Tax=Striga asiatica TaxID=4170 RepID=A0A5A7R5W8_STRAF|nr:v-type ATP synthase subunit D [Striga asiatica]
MLQSLLDLQEALILSNLGFASQVLGDQVKQQSPKMGCIYSKTIARSMRIREELSNHGFQSSAVAWEHRPALCLSLLSNTEGRQIYSADTYVTPKFGSNNGRVHFRVEERDGEDNLVFSRELLAAIEDCMADE